MTHARTTPRTTSTPAGLRAAAGSGFTLMEMIVAVAAVAVVSVGLAAIFSAVGKTVSGGKRVSLLNTYAGLIESRMRWDFDRMTREGYLMVRQQWVHEPSSGNRLAVRVDETQRAAEARYRRIDEIMFFTRGKTQSARLPVAGGLDGQPIVVSSDAARVYYGHGQIMPLDPDEDHEDPNNPHSHPQAWHTMPPPGYPNLPVTSTDAYLGVPPNGSLDNPNLYAGNWTLLRLETVLAKPVTTVSSPPDMTGLDIAYGAPATLDSGVQAGGNPACASIFRSLSRAYPVGGGYGPANFADPGMFNTPFPRFASGLVDVARTDLEDIRLWVTCAQIAPQSLLGPATAANMPMRRVTFADAPMNNPPNSLRLGDAIDLAHMWMDDGWPAQSAYLPAGTPANRMPAPSMMNAANIALDPAGSRVRYEPQPPHLLHAYENDGARTLAQVAFDRAHQIAMASNNFLPRCSEFVVEWSFGDTDVNGETIWFGPPRNPANPSFGDTLPYPLSVAAVPGTPAPPDARHYRPIKSTDGTTFNWVVSDRLIYGYSPNATDPVMTSFFGYVDPSAPRMIDLDDTNYDGVPDGDGRPDRAEDPNGNGVFDTREVDANGNGLLDPNEDFDGDGRLDSVPEQDSNGNNQLDPDEDRDGDGHWDRGEDFNGNGIQDFCAAGPTPWPWPRLIRVTVVLSDPQNPAVESTFQYIFSTPEAKY